MSKKLSSLAVAGGLRVAVRLVAKGHNVRIFEKRNKLGGRAYVYEINDYNDNADFTLSQIEQRSPTDQAGYLKFIQSTQAIFEQGFVELADKPFLTLPKLLGFYPTYDPQAGRAEQSKAGH